MRDRGLALLAVVTLVISACAGPVDVARERAALLRTDQEWAAAVGSGNLDKIVSYWADDAIVLPPDAVAVVGKQPIREFVAASLKLPGFTISWEATQVVIAANGDMGYTVGTNKVTMLGANGRPVTTVGKAVTVWRKESNGTWRCVLDIWNADSSQSKVALVGP